MDLHLLVGIILVGAGVGFLSGAFGKGGSAVSTPLLHALGVPAIVAIASPLPATIPSSLLAGRSYAREGHVDRRIVTVGVAVGVPAVVLGALATRWISGNALVIATDVLLLGLAIRMLLHTAHTAPEPDRLVDPPAIVRVVLVVVVVGVVSGLLGNSGGFMLAPLFANVLRMPLRTALGTSLVLASALAVPGTIVHALLGHIDWTVTVTFGIASVPLATLGARAALRTRERSLALAYGMGLAALAGGLLVFSR